MMRPDQIPYEVKRAMRAAWARRNNEDAPDKHMADLAVAAINAWPGMWKSATVGNGSVILPLPQENSDD